ncbi:helix-turn-helix transcriptional regulator [Sorangium sp. So ce134]
MGPRRARARRSRGADPPRRADAPGGDARHGLCGHDEHERPRRARPSRPLHGPPDGCSALDDRHRDAVARLLASGEPSASVVARQFGTSERTLRRHLEDEGTTLRQIVAEVRRHTAEELLRESDTSTSEIAFLLGFSEVTAFARAFKRWSGRTPGQFRDEARGGRAPHGEAAALLKTNGG